MWRELTYVVRTGAPAEAVNRRAGGAEFFENFVEDLFPMSYPVGDRRWRRPSNVANATGPVKALDLAAGSGVWGIALAQKSAHVSVTAVDWPNVLGVTRKIAEREGVADRFSYIGGDLAEADFGGGYDIATLGHILHSEGEERSRALLQKTARALAPGGTIAIAEFLVNEDRTGPPMKAWSSPSTCWWPPTAATPTRSARSPAGFAKQGSSMRDRRLPRPIAADPGEPAFVGAEQFRPRGYWRSAGCITLLVGVILCRSPAKGQVTIPQEIRKRPVYCRIRRSPSSWPEITPGFARPKTGPE